MSTKVPSSMTQGLLTSAAIGSALQAHSDVLDGFVALEPAAFDMLQFRDGAWINRTPAQIKIDLEIEEGGGSFGTAASLDGGTAAGNVPVLDGSGKLVAGVLPGLVTSMFATNVIDTDAALTANSNTRIASQAAVKAYADGLIEAANALQYKGTIACAGNPNYPAANAGHMYIVSSAGKIGGGSGLDVEVGDAIICKTDSTGAGTHASVGAQWTILQFNLVGALTAANIGGSVQAYHANLTTWSGKAVPSGTVVGTSDTQTLTNKTINAENNTISNLAASMFAANVIDTDVTLAADSDTRLATQKAVRAFVAASAGGQEIGDFLLTYRDPGSDYLPLDGSVYLQSAYAALVAVIGTIDDTWSTPTKIANPGTLPASTAAAVAWSPNGRYMAVAHNSSPYVSIYDWDTGVPVKISNPATLPAGNGQGLAWSPDGRYLAVGHTTSPFVTVYDWNSGSPVKISNPANLPAAAGSAVAWSANGRWMAVVHNASPWVTFYDWNSGSPVKISNPGTLPTSTPIGVGFSPNSRYCTVCHATSPFITVYDFNSGSPVKISNPTLPAGTGSSVAWSPDGSYMAVGHQTSPFISLYDWTSGSPVKMSNPASLPPGDCRAVAWSADGRFLLCANDTTPFVTIYDWDTGVPVKIADPGTLPAGIGLGAAWSPNKRYAAISHQTSPYLTIYDGYFALGYDPATEFKLPDIDYGWVKAA